MQLASYFVTVLCLFVLITLWLNGTFDPSIVASGSSNGSSGGAPALQSFLNDSIARSKPKVKAANKEDGFSLDGLSCDRFGGPALADAQEMVYWRDIPSDNRHVSPLKKRDGPPQYLTFEPDFGGWNNIRMAMETVVALAFAMGRTLVLPPENKMYLLGKETKGQRNRFSFSHFFHMEAIHNEHTGFDIISMDDFIKREALAGRFRDEDGKIIQPPDHETGRTNFDGEPETVFKYLRQVALVASWSPDHCLAVFPSSTGQSDMQLLEELDGAIHQSSLPTWEDYVGKPVSVDASPLDRMKEMRAGRTQLCIYSKQMQDAAVVHFPTISNEPGGRLLVHFYAFLFFQDWQHDLWMKRFMRDHMRYIDEIQCASARVVTALRKRARTKDPSNVQGLFDTMHIRRGDFQYKTTRVSADEIYSMTKKKLAEGATVYIATDEKDLAFFATLIKHYDVVFLHDFMEELGDVNTNYFGMIDQLVASRGRYFFGCWFSTFTGYINRLRGYHATQDNYPDHEQGIIPSWYYTLEDRYDHMQSYYPVKQAFYAREFPTSWRNIEVGMEQFHATLNEAVY